MLAQPVHVSEIEPHVIYDPKYFGSHPRNKRAQLLNPKSISLNGVVIDRMFMPGKRRGCVQGELMKFVTIREVSHETANDPSIAVRPRYRAEYQDWAELWHIDYSICARSRETVSVEKAVGIGMNGEQFYYA